MTSPLLEAEGATRLTFDGRVALSVVNAHVERTLQFSTLAGARVRVEIPASWQAQSISSWTLLEHRGVKLGFQRAPRGSSLIHLLPDADRVHADSIVHMRGGTLAHYALDWGPEAVAGFTLWQGRWSDVFTFDHPTFERGLEAFRRFPPRDTSTGAVLERSGGWSATRDEVTIDCGTLVLNLIRRDEGAVPPWPGARGSQVELYRLEEDHGYRVLAASPSAVAMIGRDEGDDSVTDVELADMAHALVLDWS